MVRVHWSVTGPFDSIYDAIDDQNGSYSTGLSASGTASFTRACDGTAHTYYVVAVHNGQKVVRSQSVPGK
jgi:hypothetical protein